MSVKNEKINTTQNSNRTLKTNDLFNGENEITIEHKSEKYRLRITSNDKLILTK